MSAEDMKEGPVVCHPHHLYLPSEFERPLPLPVLVWILPAHCMLKTQVEFNNRVVHLLCNQGNPLGSCTRYVCVHFHPQLQEIQFQERFTCPDDIGQWQGL